MWWQALLLVLSLLPSHSLEALRFARTYGDDMVLQHSGASLWGFASPEQALELQLAQGSHVLGKQTVKASADGTWKAVLDPQPAGFSFYTITLMADTMQATLERVMFGDVWVCSGQSNMDHPMTSIIDNTTEIAAANAFAKSVRLLKVRKITSTEPDVELVELPGLETRWSPASNVTVSNFSATCFLAGSQLQQNLGYPVGLIDSSWAGVGIQTLSSQMSNTRCGIDCSVNCSGTSPYFPNNATSVYNTMIAPLHSTAIVGVLWWQGENNAPGCVEQRLNQPTYSCLWQSLIADWRARWASTSGPSIPFGFVQLEPTANAYTRWDETAQRTSVPNACLRNVFMGAALDYGDTVAGVHTRYKRPITARLVRSAMAVAYNQPTYHTGPVIASATVSGDGKQVRLVFDSVGAGGIDLRSTFGFSLCSTEHQDLCYQYSNDEYFFNATAALTTANDELILTVPAALAGQAIGLVRYEWNALPCNWPNHESCGVYSKEAGLPAPPFMLGIGSDSPQPPPCHDFSSTRSFVHPGALLGAKQLAYVKSQVGVGGSPFNLTLDKVIKYTYLNARNTSAMSDDWNGTINCGYYDTPDYGCHNESLDSTTVWIQAMLWATTGDVKWAHNAVAIINFYGKHLKAYGDFGNGHLEAAWAAVKWARAAELLASTNAPWALSDVSAFKHMLSVVTLPKLYNGSCFNGNWELAMIEAMSSIAVFTDNSTLWEHSIAMWEERLPAYVYMGSDGPKPTFLDRCGGQGNWYGQQVFNSSVDGVSQETCRDFGHLSYGLASIFNVAETALIQGVDLYTSHKDRLLAVLEFHTKYLNAAGYPPDKNPYHPGLRNVSDPLVCAGTNLKVSFTPTYNVGLSAMSRLMGGQSLPETSKYVQEWVWTLAANNLCPPFMYCEEPLTHALPAPT